MVLAVTNMLNKAFSEPQLQVHRIAKHKHTNKATNALLLSLTHILYGNVLLIHFNDFLFFTSLMQSLGYHVELVIIACGLFSNWMRYCPDNHPPSFSFVSIVFEMQLIQKKARSL